ncbi:GNAT family N-acetyltransferase [Paenibacillus sp. FSL F4-0236]|uniref:GNAT family N-acetyltransferase n=1 Tax=Paenibacillus sp. FSL F4-0236 TaxID=2954731 RepID=UPI0030F9688F
MKLEKKRGGMMEINLVPVTFEDKEVLSNLYQFYNYDFSLFTDQDVNQHGEFEVNIDYFWEGDHRWNPYLIEVSGNVAGFVVVLFENLDKDPDPTHVIYDFMILQKYRRNGIGTAAAIKTLDLFKEAKWKLAQMENNKSAIAFWRKVLKDYTKDNYTERYLSDLQKYIQAFDRRGRTK